MKRHLIPTLVLAALTMGLLACPKASTTDPTDPTSPAETAGDPCQSDDDCVVSCQEPGNCCGQFCTCSHVYSKQHDQEIGAANSQQCGASYPMCPKANCRRSTHKTVAKCQQGHCVATRMEIADKCDIDTDCKVSCRVRGQCCAPACDPCSQAYTRRKLEEIERWHRTNCAEVECAKVECVAPTEVSHHLACQMPYHRPFVSLGRAQFANTRTATWEAKNRAV